MEDVVQTSPCEFCGETITVKSTNGSYVPVDGFVVFQGNIFCDQWCCDRWLHLVAAQSEAHNPEIERH